MLVHCRVTPSSKFAGTHLYTWVKRGTARVKGLAQKHNVLPQPGLEPGPFKPFGTEPPTKSPNWTSLIYYLLFFQLVITKPAINSPKARCSQFSLVSSGCVLSSSRQAIQVQTVKRIKFVQHYQPPFLPPPGEPAACSKWGTKERHNHCLVVFPLLISRVTMETVTKLREEVSSVLIKFSILVNLITSA